MGKEKSRDSSAFCRQQSWTCLSPMAPEDVLKSWMLLATSGSSFSLSLLIHCPRVDLTCGVADLPVKNYLI